MITNPFPDGAFQLTTIRLFRLVVVGAAGTEGIEAHNTVIGILGIL